MTPPPRRSPPSAAALALILAACASSAPSAQDAPQLEVQTSRYAGNALAGPQAFAGAEGDAGLAVSMRGVWVERMPPELEPLETEARLVLTPARESAIQAYAGRTRGWMHARGEVARALVAASAPESQAWREDGVLLPGAALRTDVRAVEASATRASANKAGANQAAPTQANTGPAYLFSIEASRPGAAREVSLLLAVGAVDTDEREIVVLERPLPLEEGALVLAVPRARESNEPGALLVLIELAEAADAGMLESSLREIELSARESLERRSPLTGTEAERREVARAIADIPRPERARSAFLFLAMNGGAPLAQDVALVANDADLRAILDLARPKLLGVESRAGAAWALEHSSWTWTARHAAEERLDPALAGLLLRHGGEAARLASAMEDLAQRATSVENMQRLLAEENRLLLEDPAPSARLRAYDWLAARGRAPAGYDPLASAEERRAALERDRAQGEGDKR